MVLRRAALVASLAVASVACAERRNPDARGAAGAPEPPTRVAARPSPNARASERTAPTAPATGPYRFVIVGGGFVPESNEVSLEQDVALARQTLPGPGVTLFAGGGDAVSVRELAPELKGDPMLLALGELFAPRPGRQSRYRRPSFPADPATLGNVEARLGSALGRGSEPLLLYIAGHGEPGTDARGNSVALWGGGALSVARLAELHASRSRPLRVIATSCFSGGFAELAFERADVQTGRPARTPRCGLFAGTADRETSGCDPNPDRRQQESYGLHFLRALAGARKDGSPLPDGSADFDGDGEIGLLDAHTWARIEALSLDVPTTTSERWLASVETGSAPIDESLLPEDVAVIQRLGAALALNTERDVRRRHGQLERELSELEGVTAAAEEELALREAEAGAALLARWPVLDDPFHPLFPALISEQRGEIERALGSSPEVMARAAAQGRVSALYERLARVRVEEARVLRVLRAYDTLHKATALLRRGGPAARYYERLLACERSVP